MTRYQPFSGAKSLTDEPIPRCGSTRLLFLEPRSPAARPAEQPASRPADDADASGPAASTPTADKVTPWPHS